MKYWPPVRTKPPIVQREFRGVSKLERFSLPEIFSPDADNLSSGAYPSLSVRPGFSTVGVSLSGSVRGLTNWKEEELHAFAGGHWYRYSPLGLSSIQSALNAEAPVSCANFKGGFTGINLIMANGIDPLLRFDGSAVQVMPGPAGINLIEQHADRLFGVVGNDLMFSAYRMADDWTTVNGDDADSGLITVETSNGETISAVKSGLTNLTIFKPSSIHKLYGYSASDFMMQTVTREVGALNNNCAVTIEGIMYIMDDGGIYEYNGGTVPSRSFSLPVQEYIDKMNKKGAVKYACLGTADKKLYVSIPMNQEKPDTVLEYDTQYRMWSVWTGFSATAFGRLGGRLFIGDDDSRVMEMNGTTDDGAPIAWNWHSKPFGSDSLSQRIRWGKMWIVADVPVGSTLNVYLSKSDSGRDDFTLVQSVSPREGLQSARIIIPTDKVANANWMRVAFSGVGPVQIKEWAREEHQLPLV